MADAPAENTKRRGRPWKKGQTGNPGGRPKGISEFRAMCREYTADSVRALADALRGADRVAAARVLLSYGWGPPQADPADMGSSALKRVIVEFEQDDEKKQAE